MFQDGLFRGKKILITAGGTGLGRGMAQRLLILGAEIAICGRRKGVCDETAEALMKAHGGVVKAYGVDIRDAPAVEAMIDEIFRDGPLTSLVNNATKEVNPFGRVGWIEELQNLAAFLLSDGCRVTRCRS